MTASETRLLDYRSPQAQDGSRRSRKHVPSPDLGPTNKRWRGCQKIWVGITNEKRCT